MEIYTNQQVTPAGKVGNEVQLSRSGMTLLYIAMYLLFFIGGTLLFIYIWDETSFPGFDRYVRQHWMGAGIWLSVFGAAFSYAILQWTILFLLTDRKWNNISWCFSWRSTGFYPAKCISLKHYRLYLSLPGLLTGAPPLIHGYCTGNAHIYIYGMLALLMGSSDLLFWVKLRRFDAEDLIRQTSLYRVMVICRHYGRRNRQ